jgi:hypothetical protein
MQSHRLTALFGFAPFIFLIVADDHTFAPADQPGKPKGLTQGQRGNSLSAGSIGSDRQVMKRRGPYEPFDYYWEVGDSTEGENIGREMAKKSEQTDLKFLIATVPDPIDSRFAYRFDGMLDAIEDAVESQSWALDHFWLPWAPTGQQPGVHDRLKSTLQNENAVDERDRGPNGLPRSDMKDLLSESAALRRRMPGESASLQELEPGVLIFRRQQDAHEGQKHDRDERPKILVVLLVGETPTTGVHKKAMSTALSIIGAYQACIVEKQAQRVSGTTPVVAADAGLMSNADANGYEFKIIGPYFSGSAQSLAVVISEWLKDEARRSKPSQKANWRFNVVTGSAQRIHGTEFIRLASADPGRATVEFHSMLNPFDHVMHGLFEYLQKANGEKALDKVALLTESDTEFGSPITDEQIRHWLHVDAADKHPHTQVTQVKFPFKISEIALAYDEMGQKRDRNTPSLVRPSSALTIPFDEAGCPRESVPALSPRMSTATSEFVVGKILEMIYTEDFRYIGIVATDTRDTIFLAGLIHQFCPDVQVFAPTGDLLLAHPQYSAELRGMIVASTYPLFSAAQRWAPPYHRADRRRHQFSCQEDEGTFNATSWLLLNVESPKKRGPLSTRSRDANEPINSDLYEQMFDYAAPFGQLRKIEHLWAARKKSTPKDCVCPDRCFDHALDDPDRPPIWFGMVAERGLWPLQFDIHSSSDPHETKPGSAYVRELTHSSPLEHQEFVEQFIPIIPRFTWHWGAGFLVLSSLAWLLIVVQLRGLLGAPPAQSESGWRTLERVLRFDASPVRVDSNIAISREVYVLFGWLILLGTYYFFAVRPCWIVLRYSPWAVFVNATYWSYLLDAAKWQWCYSAIAICSSYLTFFLILTLGFLRFTAFLELWFRKAPAASRTDRRTQPRAPAQSQGFRRFLRYGVVMLVPVLVVVISLSVFPRFWNYAVLPLVATGWSALDNELDVHVELGSQLLSFERSVALNNGVSPFVPVLFLALISGLWLTCQLLRIYYFEQFWDDPAPGSKPDGPAKSRLELLFEYRKRIRSLVSKSLLRSEDHPTAFFQRPLVLFAFGIMVLVLSRLLHRVVPSVDFGAQTEWLVFWLWCLVLTVIFTLLRFIFLWNAIKDLLRVFTSLPMLEAFGRATPVLSRTFGRYLGQFRITRLGLSIPVQQWITVARGFDDVKARVCLVMYDKKIEDLNETERPIFDRVERSIKGFPSESGQIKTSAEAAKEIQAKFFDDTSIAGNADAENVADSPVFSGLRLVVEDVLHVLVPYWRSTAGAQQFGTVADAKQESTNQDTSDHASRSDLSATAATAPEPTESLQNWMRALEDLVALRVVAFVSHGAFQLKNLGAYLAVAPVLLLLTVSSYPLQPQRFMIVFVWTVLLMVVAFGVGVVIQMERNEFLSRVSSKKSSRLGLDPAFLRSVLAFLVPLLFATLSQFPFVSDTINQWLEPITRVWR